MANRAGARSTASAALALGAHIAGDLITSFGTMIFAPLSDARYGLGHHLHHRPVVQRHHPRGARSPRSSGAPRACPRWRRAWCSSATWDSRPVLKERALEYARDYARAQGLRERGGHRLSARGVAVQLDRLRERRAVAPLRARQPRAQGPAAAGARFRRPHGCGVPAARGRRTGKRARATARAPRSRHSRARPGNRPRSRFMRWFAEKPAFDGLGQGSTCVWFVDLRFINPGREWVPFQYGACREANRGALARLSSASAGGGRRAALSATHARFCTQFHGAGAGRAPSADDRRGSFPSAVVAYPAVRQ